MLRDPGPESRGSAAWRQRGDNFQMFAVRTVPSLSANSNNKWHLQKRGRASKVNYCNANYGLEVVRFRPLAGWPDSDET